jgi:tRNA (guanine-N7-)-methyltransferase
MSVPEREPRKSYEHAPRLPEGERIDPRELLGSGRVELEIGPGTGAFLLGKIDREPDLHLLAFEIRKKWAVRINDRIEQRGQSQRARVFAEDAKLALPRLLDASVVRVYVHFPDPWWKKRHQKRLLLQPSLLDEVARVLGDDGELFVQTDVADRAAYYERSLLAHPAFAPLGAGRVDEDPGFGARSSRERRALEDGLPIVRLRFTRRPRSRP